MNAGRGRITKATRSADPEWVDQPTELEEARRSSEELGRCTAGLAIFTRHPTTKTKKTEARIRYLRLGTDGWILQCVD